MYHNRIQHSKIQFKVEFEAAMQREGNIDLDFSSRPDAPHYDCKATRIAYGEWLDRESDTLFKD